jgi:hypothetical protein
MQNPDFLLAINPLITIFNKQSIAYYISGSVASSIYGIARSTMDIDIIADLKVNHVSSMIKSLEKEYYIDEDMIKDAITRQSSFNLIHLKTMIKIDVFIHKFEEYSEQVLLRKRKDKIDINKESPQLFFSSPEDIIINKLLWYESGSRVSERQWLDVLGVIKIQSKNLDFEYLLKWADKLHILELLKTALLDSGIEI